MAVNGSIIYTFIGILMLSLGSLFYSLINYSDSNSPLPKEYCWIQLLYSTQPIARDVLNDSSGQTTFWILFSVSLPFWTFLLDLCQSDILKRLSACTHWRFWTAAYVQHAEWLWPHVLGQTVSFGTTEILRYFFLTPNEVFWQQCTKAVLNSSDITAGSNVVHTTNSTRLTLSNFTTTTPPPTTTPLLFTLGCQNNASLPLSVSLLCLNTTISDVNALQLWEQQLLYFLLQNLHSLPNLCLVLFGSATFILLKRFVEHPCRPNAYPPCTSYILFNYFAWFFVMFMYFYDSGKSSFLDNMVSFNLGLFIQCIVYFTLRDNSTTWCNITTTIEVDDNLSQQQIENLQIRTNTLRIVYFNENENIIYKPNNT